MIKMATKSMQKVHGYPIFDKAGNVIQMDLNTR